MRRLPPRSTRAATLLPYTTLFRSIASALLAEAGIVAPGVVGERNHAELHRKLAEVPVRAAPDDLAVAIKLGGGAARVGRLARSGNAEEILRSEEHTSELQSLMRISYAVFCLKKKKRKNHNHKH